MLHELSLGDLHGIGTNMELRLHSQGIHTVEQLCAAPKELLRGIWGGIEGERLWHRIRGEVTEDYDANPTKRTKAQCCEDIPLPYIANIFLAGMSTYYTVLLFFAGGV